MQLRKRGYQCENRRTLVIFDNARYPVVSFRFNQDTYVDENGVRVKECFKEVLDKKKGSRATERVDKALGANQKGDPALHVKSR